MKTKVFSALLAVLVLAVFATDSFAQRGWKGSGGWGAGAKYQRMYNPATVETISGEVIAIDRITPMRGMSYGIHLQVKTEKETIAVHLGPSWYIERLDTKIEKGDKIDIKGSRVTVGTAPAIIAAEVKKGDAVLKLRDDNGFPVWAGWRR